MSGSTARKVQPFTISTKLSLPKCSLEFPRDSCTDIPLAALNNHDLHQNLNECVSLYLAQTSLEPAGGRFESATPIEEVVASDDCINSNSLSRSIKKITLSNWHGKASLGEEGIFRGPSHASAEKNCNNNNCRAGKAQFKVFLRKEVEPKEEKQDARSPQAGDNFLVGRVASFLTASSVAASPWKECAKNTKPGTVVEQKPCIESSTGVADLSKWSLLLAQFNCDMVQAEKWVRGKLHDLKDGCRFQEWEQIAQILQRDMKDFENTIIKLNRMGEQLMIQPKSSTEIERRLQTLQEQWQLLKHMATNQTKTVVGFKNLQEFNQKAEQLEDWIRQKEEKPLLAILLQEKADKVQITRRILDLKQEELQFQAVHEELNSLAHKLEKQGKSEGRSITTRRKYLNKMWLQLQRTLKEHHETLQQALEAAAFLQQADVLLSAIHAKLRHLYGERKQNESESSPDLDIRDIASQVMMLDVTMSQLISLHPSLTAQVSLKHQDIKESWAQLQQLLRSDNPPQLALTKESIDSSSPNQVLTTITKNPGQDAEEKLVREVQKDTPEIMAECVTSQENNSDLSGRETITSDTKSRRKFVRQSKTLKDLPQQEAHLQDICQDADGEIQQLLHTDHRWSPEMEDALEELGELWAELKKRHQENGMALQEIDTALQLVGELEAAECWLETVAALLSEPRATKNLDDLHRDLQKIGTLKNKAGAWATKIHTLQEEMQMVPSSEHTAAAVIQRKMERVKEKLACVQEALQRQATDLHDSLILMEFLQNVQMDQTLNQRSQIKAAPNQFSSPESLHLALAQSAQQGNSKDMSTPLKELQEAVEMLNNVVKERERALKAVTETESQECFTQVMKDKEEIRLSWVTSQIETIRERTETLAQDIIQAERSFTTVKSEMDLLDVQDVQKRQEEIESDMSQLEGNIEELERAVTHLVQASDESRRILEILEAWKDLQKVVLENSVHGQQTVRLWQFFKDYLAIISWTEDTRAQIFSENLNAQGLSEAPWENLKNSMEAKFKEFEELAAAGWELVTEEHYLSETIKERMEELQNMLGWVMVRCQAQCSPKDAGNKNDEQETQDSTLNIPQNLQVSMPPIEVNSTADVAEADGILNFKVLEKCSEGQHHKPQNEPVSTAFALNVLPGYKQSLEESGNGLPFEVDVPKGTLVLEPSETPVLLVPQTAPGSLGGTVSLILSIGKEGEKKAAGSQTAPSPSEGQETLHKILPSKLELQMMEGPLERKNLLQAGGRKANSRSWNTFHTVLMRQTLCFYQDKKDTLKQSSVMALPLNLSGAVCTLETEYTKKSNCFTLQLNDGSKYLLRAPTEPLMKEWVTKLQQNSGLPEVDFFPSASQPAQGMTSVVSAIPGQGVGHFQSFQKKLSTKSQEIRFLPKSSVKLQLPYNTHSEPLDTTASQTGNGLRSAPIYTTEQNLKQCSPLEPARSQDPQLCQEDDCGLVTGKRRSYSFTSATYQKITPLSKSKEPLGIGNNYSVTLYIGEQAPTTPPRPRCHSFIATPSGARETVGEQNQGASSRQKNKSVFRKFFGKKD
ncbi:spectrin beta chain, non-erythrocytic 1-like isoform X8 [Python bivittatus]|uniref:Spectrin beta chain, non-erythrocytic 1-like isoform X8 n=1 Tax=Python bivittatus TaxID=176946 RepID=A0A9F5ITH9_PYTBI|nr:spectrin beta chain, non-erythrocytic 1-like isoform X8 [Python bivittatus]